MIIGLKNGLISIYGIVIKFYMSNDSFKYYYCLYIYMILYSIQWQASHGNWSCYANKPTMQIIKNLHIA